MTRQASEPRLGVVIPTLDEAVALPRLLDDLSRMDPAPDVIVADGGSGDGTPEVAEARGARLLRAPRGRARQLDAGARALSTPWLLFLHADSRLPRRTRDALRVHLTRADPREACHFHFALEGRHWFWRFIETGQVLRERLFGLVYGDQGLLVSRSLFEEVGGYPDLPLMEDVEMIRRLRRAGRVRPLPVPLPTSPRRYEEAGRWRGWLRNTFLIFLYRLGVPPRRLARFYPARYAAERRLLLVFAKEPVPGRVKTRLARDVGSGEAARIYRAMGRRVVDRVRVGSYRTRVCFDPPEARKAVSAWLGREVEYRPQGPGDLGTRLAEAFEAGFRSADRVVVVGTDAPDLGRELVEKAFRRLASADLVLGPAEDGGYYLLGLRRPAPALFRDIPWSTAKVLAATRARAEDVGLDVFLLPPLRDVDTADDLGVVRDLRPRE